LIIIYKIIIRPDLVGGKQLIMKTYFLRQRMRPFASKPVLHLMKIRPVKSRNSAYAFMLFQKRSVSIVMAP